MTSARAVLVAGSLAVLLLSPGAAALGFSSAQPKAYIIGYELADKDGVLDLLSTLGVRVQRELKSVNAVVTAPTERDLASLLDGRATYIEPNLPTRSAGAQWDGAQWNGAQWDGAQWNGAQWDGAQWDGSNDPGAGSQWGLTAIRAKEAWAVERGHRSANICVVDSGVDLDHLDLARNAWAREGISGYNAINGTNYASDDAGHGTHVAGVASAVTDNGLGVAGVSNSRLMSAKVIGANGTGKVGDLVVGMTWCADHGADVVLLALSVDGESKTIERAITYLVSHDIVIVASAGNSGSCLSCVSFPARDPRVIAVAAVNETYGRASFSSGGAEVALAAPGTNILSTFDNGRYASGSGTSQAAAYVAGAAALLLERNPTLTAPQVRERLTATARDLGPAGRDPATGAGLLDVGAALQG